MEYHNAQLSGLSLASVEVALTPPPQKKKKKKKHGPSFKWKAQAKHYII